MLPPDTMSNLINTVFFKNPSLRTLGLVFLNCSLIMLLTGCSGQASKQTVETSFQVQVDNSSFKRVTSITKNVDIKAKGSFKPGTYYFKNTAIVIPKDTSFELSMKTPVKDPSSITTQNASGVLTTSKQVTFGSVEIPKTLEFQSGKVEVFVDFAKCFSAFLLSLVQVDNQSSNMKDMIESITLEKVILELKSDSTFKLGKKTLNIGENSKAEFTNVVVDKNLDYKGKMFIDCNFSKGSRWLGEKLDCEFEGGNALLSLNAEKSKGIVKLTLPKNSKEKRSVNLEECLLSFGKDKRSKTKSKKAVLVLDKFAWQTNTANSATMSMDSQFNLIDTKADIKTDIHQTIAHFPGKVPGKLEVVTGKKNDNKFHFETTESAKSDAATVSIAKKDSSVVLKLADVDISKASYDKSGSMNFNLSGSQATIKDLSWKGKGKNFSLNCGAGSQISVPEHFLVEKQKEGDSTKVKLPVKLNLGSANLKSEGQSIRLDKLKGALELLISKSVIVQGELAFSLPDLHLLSGYKAKVNAKGIKITSKNGNSKFAISECSLIIPDKNLESTLKSKVPSEYHIKLDKKVQEKKEWRYRNAFVKEVNIKDFEIHKMKTEDNELIKFSASGKATSFGTVEKSGIILSRKRWTTKPWSMSGNLNGEGELRYNFVKHKKDKKPHLKYKLTLNVSMPEDVSLDWSKVSGGMIKMLERKAIVKKLRTVKIPLKKEGEIDLFKSSSPFGKEFQVKDLKVIDLKDSTKVTFELSTAS